MPKLRRQFCAICWAPFLVPIVKGGSSNRTRCDKHMRKGCAPIAKRDLADVPRMLVTGVAIGRDCLYCGQAFIARDEAALYCDLYCFARAKCRKQGVGVQR